MSTATIQPADEQVVVTTKQEFPPVARKLRSLEEFFAFLKDHGLTRRPRVALFGDDRFGHPVVIRSALEKYAAKNAVVIEGELRGTEQTARGIAFHGLHLPTAGFPAPFRPGLAPRERFNALCARNSLMLAALTPGSTVLAFTLDAAAPTVTRDAAGKAYLAGMKVVLVDSEGSSMEYALDGEPKLSRADLLAQASTAY